MKWFRWCMPALLVASVAPRAYAQALDLAAFERYASESFAAYEVPGAAVAIVKDGDVVVTKGFGVRTLGTDEPVDAETLFAIASCTKAFTTALLATLVDEGKLSWDDRVIDHLPEFRLFDLYATREMTLRDLLSHRSGIASGGGDLLWLRSTYDRDEILHRVRFVEPDYSFRSRYGYQNVMFIVAGELAAAASGKTWDALLQERIFAPLGMTSASSSIRERRDDGNWATPHVRVNGTVQAIQPENVDNLGGAGAVNASADAMSRWLLLQLGRGKYEETRIYSEQQAEEMWAPSTIVPNGPPSPRLASRHPKFTAYGLGWRLKDYLGRKMVHHGGGLAGMTSLTTLVPEENLGIVVLTNQETSVQTALTYWIVDRYLGAPMTDWTDAQRKDADERWKRLEPRLEEIEGSRVPGTSPSLELKAFAKRYTDALYGDAIVEMRDGSLVLRFAKSPPFDARLDHWHYDTFVARFEHHSIADAFVTFVLGPDGDVEAMLMKPYSPFADSSYDYERLRFVPAE